MVSGGENLLDGSRNLYYYDSSNRIKPTLKGSNWQAQSTILLMCMVVPLA